MSTPELPFPTRSEAPPSDETRPGFRTKTIATRLTPVELAEVEATAESAGQSLAEWLRETVLRAARRRPADPIELLLAEVWALRYTLLNLFHSSAKAASEGTPLLSDSIVKIRDQADTVKLQKAHKILADFLALGSTTRAEK
ncbi:MAG: plasmid mobilization protein [Acidobacteriota bacterium]